MEKAKIKSTSKYPTTLIVKGLNYLGIELAKRLIEQDGYVIIVDTITNESEELLKEIKNRSLITVLDIAAISTIENDIRRLDYVFYLSHETQSYIREISSQEFLQQSNYLDNVLDLSLKFNTKFLLTTSIKAHQLLLETKSLDIDSNTGLIPQYSETEIQRYSENLTMEYSSKMGLDGRIVRVGELLGKGLNPSSSSSYLKLILNALDGKQMAIEGDGLETDFYIHYLDAVRGLIQAMFSINTIGKTFSLSIPEEISILSIAYRIAEIIPEATEIKFVDYSKPLPPLRLYKPAVNLTSIGWVNKISINRSLAQTIDFLKERSELFKTKEISDNIGKFEDKTPETADPQGALSRLISERKQQEKSRIGSVVIANKDLKTKMNKNSKIDSKKRISIQAFWLFESLKQQFAFLKNISLKEFIFSLLLVFIFGLIYIFTLSPVLNITANVFQIHFSSNSLEDDLSSYNLSAAAGKLDSISNAVTNIQNRLSDLNFMFVITGRLNDYSQIQNSLEIQHDYIEGLQISIGSLVPLFDYLKNPGVELISKISGESSLLDVKITNNDSVNKIKQAEAELKLGAEKLKLTRSQILSSFDIYPSNIQNLFLEKITKVNENIDFIIDVQSSYNYISSLIGINGQKNYLFLIQDNLRETPGGGEFAGYLLITLENGYIVKVDAKSIDSLPTNKVFLENIEIEELNLVSTLNFTSNQIDFKDLTHVKNKDVRSIAAKRYLETVFSTKIDIVSWLNLSGLEQLAQGKTLEVEGQVIDVNNFIQSVNTLIGDDTRNIRRNFILTQLASELLANSFNNKTLLNDISLLGNVVDFKELTFFTNDFELKAFFNSLQSSKKTTDYFEFGLKTEGISTIPPKLTLVGKVIVFSDTSTSKNFTLNPAGINNVESIWMCNPSGSKNFNSEGIPDELVSRNFSSEESCQIFLANEVQRYPLAFETLSFENSSNSLYNYSLSILKPSGVNVNYEIEFVFETSKTIQPELTPTISRINNFIFSGELNSDIIFNFFENE